MINCKKENRNPQKWRQPVKTVLRNPPWRNRECAPEGLILNPHLKWGLVTYKK